MDADSDRTASLMTPAKLAQLKARPGAAASPAAWLDQLATDAGSGHVRRLLDLRRQLESQLRDADAGALRAAAAAAAAALGQVDLSLLQPKGWFARATGKGKEAAAAFGAQVDRCARAGEDLADEARKLHRYQQVQGAGADRTVLEIEVEVRALEKIMEQGARWLQDMRNQLKAREAAGGDAATLQKIEEDTRRCELLVSRLKQLRSASNAAQALMEQCRAAAGRRERLAQDLQQRMETGWNPAQKRLAALAEEAAAGGDAPEGVDATRTSHAKLTAALEQLATDIGALQTQERAAAEAVAAVQAPLQAAS